MNKELRKELEYTKDMIIKNAKEGDMDRVEELVVSMANECLGYENCSRIRKDEIDGLWKSIKGAKTLMWVMLTFIGIESIALWLKLLKK